MLRPPEIERMTWLDQTVAYVRHLEGLEEDALDLVFALRPVVVSAAAAPHASIECRALREKWLAALKRLGIDEAGVAQAERAACLRRAAEAQRSS